jgi:hypothetical protein
LNARAEADVGIEKQLAEAEQGSLVDEHTRAMAPRAFRDPFVQEDGVVRLVVDDQVRAVIVAREGVLSLEPASPAPDEPRAIAAVADDATLDALADGHLHPVVAALQGRLRTRGDRRFGLIVLLALRASSDRFARAERRR